MIDAVDESQPRENLLRVLRDFAMARFKKIQLLATSRQSVNIKTVIGAVAIGTHYWLGHRQATRVLAFRSLAKPAEYSADFHLHCHRLRGCNRRHQHVPRVEVLGASQQ